MENQNTNPVEVIPAGTEPETKDGEVCTNCGAPLAEGQEFCTKCGTARKKKPVCGKCGAELEEGQEFCPKCGQKVDLAVDAEVSSAINQFNAGVEKQNQKKKKTPIIIAAVVVVAIILVAFVAKGVGSKGPDLQALYDEYCDSAWADIGSDGSYLNIDTNPYDWDDYTAPGSIQGVRDINAALGLPDYVLDDMASTTAMMGRQSETFDDIGVTVSWSYHPDNGLEVSYKLK